MFKNGRWKHVGDRVGRLEADAMTGREDDVMADLMTPVDGQGGEMVEVAAGGRVYLVRNGGPKGVWMA